MISVLLENQAIEWDATALELLRREVVSCFHRSPPADEEMIGILYGRTTRTGWKIMKWQSLKRENAAQPALPLKESEEILMSRLVRIRGLEPVGFFRTRTKTSALLTPEDDQFGKNLFRSKPHVAIILRPGFQRPTNAAFFIIHPETVVEKPIRGMEVTLEPQEFSTRNAEDSSLESIPLPGFLGSHTAVPRLSASQWNWKRMLMVFTGLVLLGLPVLFLLLDRPLHLEAEIRQDRVYITWNRFAGILTRATGGELQVADRTRELTLDELRHGMLAASKPSGDFRIQLLLRGPYAGRQRAVILLAQKQ